MASAAIHSRSLNSTNYQPQHYDSQSRANYGLRGVTHSVGNISISNANALPAALVALAEELLARLGLG